MAAMKEQQEDFTNAINEITKGKTPTSTTAPTATGKDGKPINCKLCDKLKHCGGVLICLELEQNKGMCPGDWASTLDKMIAKRKEQLSKAKKDKEKKDS